MRCHQCALRLVQSEASCCLSNTGGTCNHALFFLPWFRHFDTVVRTPRRHHLASCFVFFGTLTYRFVLLTPCVDVVVHVHVCSSRQRLLAGFLRVLRAGEATDLYDFSLWSLLLAMTSSKRSPRLAVVSSFVDGDCISFWVLGLRAIFAGDDGNKTRSPRLLSTTAAVSSFLLMLLKRLAGDFLVALRVRRHAEESTERRDAAAACEESP